VPSTEARRALRLEYGASLALREDVRASGWEHVVGTIAGDVRYAIRGLRDNAGFTTVVIATLAFGVGATTAIFSAVKPVLFESLPYPSGDRIVAIWDRAVDGSPADITFGTYHELMERSRSFEAIAAMKPWQPTLTGQAEPERLEGQRVSASYFRALGVHPAFGRDFAADDDRPNAAAVVILSNGLWRRRFGADPSIVNRTIALNDMHFTVVGIMPAAFENVALEAAEVWAPLQYDPALPQTGREWGHHLQAVARLRPGVPLKVAASELNELAQRPIAEHPRVPWAALGQGLILRSLQEDITREVRPALIAVLGAVLLVLAIACVNVTNLLLARAARRRGEFAMRAALGASRWRLVTQLLTESVVLALIGGALGIAVAYAGLGTLTALTPLRLPRLESVRVDAAVLTFAIATTTLIGIVVGLVPALQAAAAQPDAFLRTSRTVAGGHRRTRGALVIAEMALAIVLLVCAGLLVRSLERLFAVDSGFDPSGLLTMQVQISDRQFDSPDATHRFFDRALEAVQRVPGVKAAAFTSQLPFSGDFEKYGTKFESSPTEGLEDDHSALRYAISSSYIDTMRIPLRRGRLFNDRDTVGPQVALINEAFARRRFPGLEAVGQRLHLGRTDLPWITVVGVVGDVKQTSLATAQSDAVYIPASQWYSPDRVRSIVARTNGNPAALSRSVRQAIWSVDKDQPVVRVATMDGLLAATAAGRRFVMLLFEAFALAALALAAIGIYGVLSGSVADRVREIGVRSALGASTSDILTLVMRHGMILTGTGAALGLATAALVSRGLVSMLFGISPLDPTTYIAVVVVLSVVSAAACGIPAWRAVRIDPSVTLRAE
jgi:putative ABC transport system permease protein